MDQEEMLARLEEKLDEKYGERIRKLEFELDRAKAYQEIMNLMGRYAFLHSGEEHVATLDCFAMDRDDTSVEIGPYGVYLGGDGVKRCYVNGESALDGDRLGHMCEHHIDTAVVEIAADGKTAKGVFMSPGHGTNGKDMPEWMWGKYGVDFIKENGEWKIWHLHAHMSFRTPFDTPWTEIEPMDRRIAKGHFAGLPQESGAIPDLPTTYFEEYATDRIWRYWPKCPEPYETFEGTPSMVGAPEGYVYEG